MCEIGQKTIVPRKERSETAGQKTTSHLYDSQSGVAEDASLLACYVVSAGKSYRRFEGS